MHLLSKKTKAVSFIEIEKYWQKICVLLVEEEKYLLAEDNQKCDFLKKKSGAYQGLLEKPKTWTEEIKKAYQKLMPEYFTS